MTENGILQFECISDIQKAKDAWNEFSDGKNIYDNWDFRYCFYKYFAFPLSFYVASLDGAPIGLMPLQYNTEKKYFEFFGGCFMEDNRIFMKNGYESYIPKFYEMLDKPARLEDIIGEDPFTKSLDVFEYKYVADLSGIKTLDEYLEKIFKARMIKKIKKRYDAVDLMGVEIVENRFQDIGAMMDLNIKMFGAECSFLKPHRREIFRDLLELDLEFHMLSFVIKGKLEAVSLAFKYRDTFVGINAGVNKEDYPDLSTYTILAKFKKAISLGSKKYDAGLEDLGWKENWHFEKVPERIFTKK